MQTIDGLAVLNTFGAEYKSIYGPHGSMVSASLILCLHRLMVGLLPCKQCMLVRIRLGAWESGEMANAGCVSFSGKPERCGRNPPGQYYRGIKERHLAGLISQIRRFESGSRNYRSVTQSVTKDHTLVFFLFLVKYLFSYTVRTERKTDLISVSAQIDKE